jgi:hypothetical protein
MQTLFLALFCLLSALPGALPESTWREVSSKEGGFSALMPDEPKTNVIYTETRKGGLYTHTISASDEEWNEYLVSWTEYPKDSIEDRATEKTFNRMRDALVGFKEGKVLSDNALTLEGHPARAVTFETKDEQLTNVRFYFVENRLYQVMVHSRNGNKNAADAERFLNSFKLLPGKLI